MTVCGLVVAKSYWLAAGCLNTGFQLAMLLLTLCCWVLLVHNDVVLQDRGGD
jgi:hypothetical protein